MATVSITSNEGALESASAVLEVVATNPKYTRLKADAIARNLSTQVGLVVGHRRRRPPRNVNPLPKLLPIKVLLALKQAGHVLREPRYHG